MADTDDRLTCRKDAAMSLNLNSTVGQFLEERVEQKFTAKEIAQWIFQNYPEACLEKKQRSGRFETDDELIQQIAAEIGAQHKFIKSKFPGLKMTEGRPRRYYISNLSDQEAVAETSGKAAVSRDKRATVESEHDLYPKLRTFLLVEHDVHAMRINEKHSSNNNGPRGNHWLYPDLVGLENLSGSWSSDVKDCVKNYADKLTKIWSFEVKKRINRTNVRESYFQAVSNSSWANMGYLVAAEVEGSDTLKEMRLLYAIHGIGLIVLDSENPSESEILIPARERPAVDWNSANRLASENKDFLNFLKQVRRFYQTGGDIVAAEWS